jgi:DNA helicase IV
VHAADDIVCHSWLGRTHGWNGGRRVSGSSWSGRGWEVSVTNSQLMVTTSDGRLAFGSADVDRIILERRWWRWQLRHAGTAVRLRGLSRDGAAEITLALRRLGLVPQLAAAVAWARAVTDLVAEAQEKRRWLTTEETDRLRASRPAQQLARRVREAGCETLLAGEEQLAVQLVDGDLDQAVAALNERFVEAELDACAQFFETIEKSPLTAEQARAVVTFDNRVQLLAAAGSGKTSVMIARAAYAVSRGLVSPDRILLLAFNRNAAVELQERIEARFAEAGIDATGVTASTFHKFGLNLIGEATGKKPRPAAWLEKGEDVRTIVEIVDQLRDSSETFRYRWDLYRMLFAAAPSDLDEGEPDAYDRATRETGYRTFSGTMVKSHGERLIADFLYLNGIAFEYEKPYAVDVASETHAQYRPDFYYPDVDAWHEHWALDRDGNPPADFEGYAEGIRWKRDLHDRHGTTLVETTWADVVYGEGLRHLQERLHNLGVSLDWNPDRPVNDEWAKPMKHEDLARFVRTFMSHVKSNSWTRDDLERRLESDSRHLQGFRTRLFLDIYWPIHDEWDRRLTDDGSVDFEDMLVQAADHLEAGRVDTPYELILVDEFQDASRARARLVRGLVREPGRFLLAVGDDWQSINRFAGADLSVMTDFETWFGRGHQLALTTTFRCSQTICDVARDFVAKNPQQFDKPMRSARPEACPPVTVIYADDDQGAISRYLDELAARTTSDDGPVTVDVLGRYSHQRDVLPWRRWPNLQVTFRTVHSSKGLEADHVIVPGLTTGRFGFPSGITDDPVLDLAMPRPDRYPHAEERRLFYVALTRARYEVVLIARTATSSPFVNELEGERVSRIGLDGGSVERCPSCQRGTMVPRRGRWGTFVGCSRFPACRHTSKGERRAG